jgi:hypothetical protein
MMESYNTRKYFVIYGAQVVAYGAFTALKSLYSIVPEAFLVKSREGNPVDIDGVSVIPIAESKLPPDKTTVLIAVTELLQQSCIETLNEYGFYNTLLLGSHEEYLLMSDYFNSIGRFPILPETNSSDKKTDLIVFEARNHRDVPLKNPPLLKSWEQTIQAGTAVTDTRLCDLTDNTGVNISEKNKLYSEMSITYWAWKNITADWKGICHYRRHFILSDEQISSISDGSVDAILPLPYLCYPNTLKQFTRFVNEGVVKALSETLKFLHPDKYRSYWEILNGQYQYTYNLVIAKNEVFNAYCEWIFTILGYMENYNSHVPEIGTTRALSYAAEVLTSLYFLSNSEKLKIFHAEKRIYV